MTNDFPFWHRPGRSPVRFLVVIAAAALIVLIAQPGWAATFVPLTSFGGGDGWLAPGEFGYTQLTTSNDQRGIAYGNGHLYLVNKAGGVANIRILDPETGVDTSTGADLGALDATGISGGTFPVDGIAVGGDGAIYSANLTTASTASGSGAYKVYKWATEASTPITAYSGDGGITGVRVGDDLAAFGSGSSTRLAAGYSNSPSVVGNNGYAIIDPTAGTGTAVGFAGTPPNAADFRLGITFTDSSHVLGAPGVVSLYRYSSFSGATGTLISSPTIPDPAGATADRLMATTVIGAKTILAMQSTGDSHVSIYDVTNPSAPVYLASGNNTGGTAAGNGNGTGALAWGATTDNGNGTLSQILYGMSTNQGIQAFTFTLESPFANNGDYNGNGVVDAADYVVWRSTLGQTVTRGTGADGDGNGTVGPEDYDHWRGLFGNTITGSGAIQSATIPEPSAFALFFASLVWGVPRRGRRWIAAF